MSANLLSVSSHNTNIMIIQLSLIFKEDFELVNKCNGFNFVCLYLTSRNFVEA